jgi:hypothetical protein
MNIIYPSFKQMPAFKEAVVLWVIAVTVFVITLILFFTGSVPVDGLVIFGGICVGVFFSGVSSFRTAKKDFVDDEFNRLTADLVTEYDSNA